MRGSPPSGLTSNWPSTRPASKSRTWSEHADRLEPAPPRLLIILSSPSGAGKSTLARRLMAWDPSLSFSVSATTRAPRPGEVDGRDYHFLDEARFKAMVADGAIAGTRPCLRQFLRLPMAPVAEAIDAGRDVLFDIDWQGAQQIRNSALGRHTALDLHPAALDPRTETAAGNPWTGRTGRDRQAHAEKLGRNQPLGRV